MTVNIRPLVENVHCLEIDRGDGDVKQLPVYSHSAD